MPKLGSVNFNSMLTLYSIFFFLFWPLVLLALLWRYGLRRTLKGLPERLGWGDPGPAGAIWVHAASVGEVRAAEPFLRALPDRFPGVPRFLTTTTVNGKELAERLGLAEAVRLAPIDRPGPLRRVLSHVRPRVVVLVETELWPFWLRDFAAQRVPVLVVNGRISDGAFPLYYRLRGFWAPLLAGLARVGVQSPRNASRFLQLGASPERVAIMGNLKYDWPLPDQARRADLRKMLGFAETDLVWLWGSTHPGEEIAAAEAFLALRRTFPRLRAVAAPRHVERGAEVRRLLEERGLRTGLRSQRLAESASIDVLVLDTVGELADMYGSADVVFVGGSLVKRGGQNPLEPARWGVPLVYGPHMENFREIDEALREAGAVRPAAGASDLAAVVGGLLGSLDDRKTVGAAARAVADRHRGALKETLRLLDETLALPPDSLRPARRPCGSC